MQEAQFIALGLVVGVLGAALMLWSMLALRIYGGGLPMNAFPPEHYVARGPYALFSHPIYFGFVAIVLGASIYFESASGFWLVTPALALGVIPVFASPSALLFTLPLAALYAGGAWLSFHHPAVSARATRPPMSWATMTTGGAAPVRPVRSRPSSS